MSMSWLRKKYHSNLADVHTYKREKRIGDNMGHPFAHAIQIAFCLGKIDPLPTFDRTRKRYFRRWKRLEETQVFNPCPIDNTGCNTENSISKNIIRSFKFKRTNKYDFNLIHSRRCDNFLIKNQFGNHSIVSRFLYLCIIMCTNVRYTFIQWNLSITNFE